MARHITSNFNINSFCFSVKYLKIKNSLQQKLYKDFIFTPSRFFKLIYFAPLRFSL